MVSPKGSKEFSMFRSPLVLPLTLIFAGVLAFMATTGILPATVLRFWPIVFVVLGLVGLVSLSSEELSGKSASSSSSKKSPAKKAVKTASAAKPAARKAPATKAKTAKKKTASKKK